MRIRNGFRGAMPNHGTGVECTLEQLCALQSSARMLDLRSVPVCSAAAGGGHRARFRSRGMEYLESRAYLPGDDIRTMDWRVTARSGRPHTKLYHEESERQMYLVVDLGPSMQFGTRRAFKSVVAAEVAALLCWAAVQHGESVGALVHNGTRRLQTSIREGRSGALAILHALVTLCRATQHAPVVSSDSLSASLLRASHSAGSGTRVVVISDFAALDDDAERALLRLTRNHQVIAAAVHDPLERSAPPAGCYTVTDGNDAAVIDTRSAVLRAAYEGYFEQRRRRLSCVADRLGITLISLSTDVQSAPALGQALAARSPRGRRRHATGGNRVV